MSPVLSFENLSLGYGDTPAVTDINCSISEGSLTAIVGPNGAGKSTLLKGVTGNIKPIAGLIDLHGGSEQTLAYLPQQTELDRTFPITVLDLVSMGLWRHIGAFGAFSRKHRDSVMEALSTVGLIGLEKRTINALSGGQLQRALFARLLLQDANIVLLDEPFSAIDSKTMSDLLSLIANWHADGRTILAVLHDQEMVKQFFPDTMLLARELVAHGSTSNVLTAENNFKARQMCEACHNIPHTCGKTAA
jgi:zinc/manganese transport system ATP-binding protein